jgi:type II secretory pathway predicted ATPase ExeA
VGQPQLRDLLRSPQLLQFAQRVSSDFHLKPLDPADVVQYIEHRLKAVGARGSLFTPEACAAIATASRGVPRVINVLCDTALVYGFAINAKTITPELIREVINDKRDFGVFPLGESLDAT